jgi:hypothetical protein
MRANVEQCETAPRTGGLPSLTLDEVVRFLNSEQIRATYRAVAEVVGGIPQGVGGRLGTRRPEGSWVVNAKSGLPSGYSIEQCHPALLLKSQVISTGAELTRQYEQWRHRR